MRHFFSVIVIVLLSHTASAQDIDNDPQFGCLRQAGSSADTGLPPDIKGVAYNDLKPETALPKCKQAAESISDQSKQAPRIWFTYARALHKAKRYQQAVDWYQKSANRGFSLAQNNLASFYEIGLGGLVKDKKKAFSLFMSAAETELTIAEFNVGVMYRDGDGVEKSEFQALKWLERASNGKFPGASKAAITILERGIDGAEPDFAAAAKFWRKLAANGDIEASFELADRLKDSKFDALSETEIHDRYEQAADAGHFKAAYDYSKWIMEQPEGEVRNQTALKYAYLAYDIAAKAPINTENGWLIYEQEAAKQAVDVMDQTSSEPRDSEELAMFRRDFVPSSMKSFTVPITCGETKDFPFKVYVWDWSRDYPQSDDQAEWIEKARGCEFPDDVVASFQKIFQIAKDSNSSFEDLTVHAFSAESEKEIGRDEEPDKSLSQNPASWKANIGDKIHSLIFHPSPVEIYVKVRNYGGKKDNDFEKKYEGNVIILVSCNNESPGKMIGQIDIRMIGMDGIINIFDENDTIGKILISNMKRESANIRLERYEYKDGNFAFKSALIFSDDERGPTYFGSDDIYRQIASANKEVHFSVSTLNEDFYAPSVHISFDVSAKNSTRASREVLKKCLQ